MRIFKLVAVALMILSSAALFVPSALGAKAKTKTKVKPAAVTTTVTIVSPHSYNPANVTIHVGDTVQWVNPDLGDHTATSDDNGATFDSQGALEGMNGPFSHTFTQAGVVPYHCLVHGTRMSGTVTVLP